MVALRVVTDVRDEAGGLVDVVLIEVDAGLHVAPEDPAELAGVVAGVTDERPTDGGPAPQDVTEAVPRGLAVQAPARVGHGTRDIGRGLQRAIGHPGTV